MPKRWKRIRTFDNEDTQKFYCDCGEQVILWFNGGELDLADCKCGREYRMVSTGYAIEKREQP